MQRVSARRLIEDRLVSFDFREQNYAFQDLQTGLVREMAGFVMRHRFSRVMELTNETLHKIFGESKPTLVLLLVSGGRVLDNFRRLTKDFPDTNVVYANLGSSAPSRATEYLMEIVGVRRQEAPLLLYLPFTQSLNGVMPKYKTSRLTSKSIKAFIESARAGALEVFKKSEIDDGDVSVRKYTQVTLNNFDQKVTNSRKYFLLGLEIFHQHAPVEIKDVFRELAESVSQLGLSDQLEVGICDLYRNEVLEKVSITGLPQIMLYDSQDKAKHVMYKGKLKANKIKRWLEEQTGLEMADSGNKKEENLEKVSGKETDL